MTLDDDTPGADAAGGWALPPFDASNALAQLRRSLREMGLAERGTAFELRGKRVVELPAAMTGSAPQAAAPATAVVVRVARRLALTPEFDRLPLASAADQRKLVDTLKKRLAQWERDE